MDTVQSTLDNLFKIAITDNKLQAWLLVKSTKGAESATIDDILRLLKQNDVAINESVRTRAEELVRLLTTDAPVPDRFLIAEGTAPQHGTPEIFSWESKYAQQAATWQEDEPVDFYSFSSILTVESGSVIGTLKPGESPKDGVDVHGAALPGRPAEQLEFDSTVERTQDDPPRVIARASGRVIEDSRSMRIDEVFCIKGDVGFETGNVDSRIDVSIDGRIPDRFKVCSGMSITVGMSIEAAQVDASLDVIVNRGIIGRNCGLVTAGRDIVSKYATEANLDATGDVRIAKQLMNSQTFVGGRLDAGRATVVGGATFVCDDAEVGNVGSDANTPTRIVVGVYPDQIRRTAILERQIEQSSKDKHNVKNDKKAELTERRDASIRNIFTGKSPKIIINGTIFARSTLVIGNRETYFRQDFKGPTTIMQREVDGRMEMVAVNPGSGSVSVLSQQKCTAEKLVECCELESELAEE